MEDDLEQKFYANDEKNPLYLSHSAKILSEKLNHKVNAKTISEFLRQQRSYTLYKNSTRKNNERNPYRVYSLDQLWEIDLAMLPQLAAANSGYIYILVCIDVFSRYAFARALQTKQPREIVKALADIFKTTNRKLYMIQSDAGKSMVNDDLDD